MRTATKTVLVAFLLAAGAAAFSAHPAQAQEYTAQEGTGVQAEVNALIAIAERKINALAEAMNEEQFAWRPGEGVRSTREVLLHIAGNNYWLPILLGINPPAGVPIGQPYQTVWDYEKMEGREAVVAALKDSFIHLKASLAAVPDDTMEAPMDIFGTPGNGRAYLMVISTHLHEHLGQMIAYARMMGVTPPWSQ